MRTLSAILLIIAASISPASAQRASWEMDHGHAADAVAASRAAAQAAAEKAAAIRNGIPLTPSQATDFAINGGGVISAGAPLTPEQMKAEEEGRIAWQARCRPSVSEDSEGLRRTRYAAPNCDLSRLNTAGAQ